MSAGLVRRSAQDVRGAVLGWGAAWAVLVGAYAAAWPAVRGNAAQYDAILADLPEALRTLVTGASPGGFGSPSGFLSAELLGVTGPLLAASMGVMLGSRVIAAQEEDGSLEVLLGLPVSRRHLLLSQALVSLGAVTGVLLAAGLLLRLLGLLGGPGVGVVACLRATGGLALLAGQALALAAVVAALTGSVGRSRAVAGAAVLATFLLQALGPSLPHVAWAVPLSPFHVLASSRLFDGWPDLGQAFALVLPTAALLALACRVLAHRDLRLP